MLKLQKSYPATTPHLHSIKNLNLKLSLDHNDFNCTVEITLG